MTEAPTANRVFAKAGLTEVNDHLYFIYAIGATEYRPSTFVILLPHSINSARK